MRHAARVMFAAVLAVGGYLPAAVVATAPVAEAVGSAATGTWSTLGEYREHRLSNQTGRTGDTDRERCCSSAHRSTFAGSSPGVKAQRNRGFTRPAGPGTSVADPFQRVCISSGSKPAVKFESGISPARADRLDSP